MIGDWKAGERVPSDSTDLSGHQAACDASRIRVKAMTELFLPCSVPMADAPGRCSITW